ncbi:YbaB/EbfC family nucleoid-associated protein [Mycobacterium sp. BMJ-28]
MTSLAESLIARIIKQRDLMQAMNEHLNTISVRVTSKDQSVSVEVDGLGAMTGLWLTDAAYRHGADGLSKLIVDTAQAAAKLAMERQSYLVKEFNQRMSGLQESPLTRWDGSTVIPS